MKYNINLYEVSSGRGIKEDGNVVNEADGINADGSRNVQSKYRDLGQAITGGALAAGACMTSKVYYDLAWVRNILCLVRADQPVSVHGFREVVPGEFEYGYTISNVAESTAKAWKSVILTPENGGITGYAIRFAIKNIGTAPTTLADVRIKVFGS